MYLLSLVYFYPILICFIPDDISEDLITLLKRRAEIDGKFFVVFGQKDESDIHQSCYR